MKIDSLHFENENWILEEENECDTNVVDIVFVFGLVKTLREYNHTALLKKIYPNAQVVGISTAGNIFDDSVSEYKAIASAVSFDSGYVKVNTAIMSEENLIEDASHLVDVFDKEDLKHIFVLGQPLGFDNSSLVKGLNLHKTCTISGAIAADENMFEDCYVFANESQEDNVAVAIGFYGKSLSVSIGCKAGWEEFGAQRIVTKAKDHTIYEIDNKPALELYKRYLGEYIDDLPASGLLFPLSIGNNKKNEVIRVMTGINDDGSLNFAAGVEEGASVRLMKTNVENLIDGASLVANTIEAQNNKRSLSLTISCGGRLSVLKQLAGEEIEAVHDILGDKSKVVGMYSHGEIAPFSDDLLDCQLHNQTMTITTLYED